jgi:invasion protein IalB
MTPAGPAGPNGIARGIMNDERIDAFENAHFALSASWLAVWRPMLAVGTSPPALRQQQQQVPKGWFKACTKQEDVDICNVQNIVDGDSGQLVTGVSLIELKGKVNRKVFQVTVPTGRLVPPGIGLQIDGGKAQKLDYVICFPDRCVAEVPLSDAARRLRSRRVGTDADLCQLPEPAEPGQGDAAGLHRRL